MCVSTVYSVLSQALLKEITGMLLGCPRNNLYPKCKFPSIKLLFFLLFSQTNFSMELVKLFLNKGCSLSFDVGTNQTNALHVMATHCSHNDMGVLLPIIAKTVRHFNIYISSFFLYIFVLYYHHHDHHLAKTCVRGRLILKL